MRQHQQHLATRNESRRREERGSPCPSAVTCDQVYKWFLRLLPAGISVTYVSQSRSGTRYVTLRNGNNEIMVRVSNHICDNYSDEMKLNIVGLDGLSAEMALIKDMLTIIEI